MNRAILLKHLEDYVPFDHVEEEYVSRTINLIRSNSDAFERSRKEGHITASAWLVDPGSQKALLLHHKKLDRWLQPGGHADGDDNLPAVAEKELLEESGISNIKLVDPKVFDVDIHLIPSNIKEVAHEHFDVRYLFTGSKDVLPIKNHESNAVKWVSWHAIPAMVNYEVSILRMLKKTKLVFSS